MFAENTRCNVSVYRHSTQERAGRRRRLTGPLPSWYAVRMMGVNSAIVLLMTEEFWSCKLPRILDVQDW
jgi:hypothetical protein